MSTSDAKTLFEPGLTYVVVQAVILALLFFGPLGPLLISSTDVRAYLNLAAYLLGLIAFVFMLLSAIHLGRNLTPLPRPKADSKLVQHGLYRYVRHPMYFGVLLAAIAWFCAFPHLLILLYVVALAILFDVKAQREELWLLERFPEYRAYQLKVKKLIPWIY